ncbi:zinc ribbon domain-containing protein [Bifidobacterium sp. 64T4]|uniref:zinc ribbon domain-containing protein n=1 Tax=Bifidobacterium pongonis TaxID=2834432 RepID=UPI001C57E108|nr:zinc ribbon domain-containing protein [Bifidobacterium pongonis]MBW3095289.1 zinc ribbon domain-containing protein [Bifidobacterium pongonis]
MRCNRCGFEGDDNDRFCSRCGAEQVPENTGAAMPGFCTFCGSPIEPGMRFCSDCGSPVGAESPASQVMQPDSAVPAAPAAQPAQTVPPTAAIPSTQVIPPTAAVPSAPAVPPDPADQSAPAAQSPSSGRKKTLIITIIAIVVVVVAVVAGFVAWNLLAHTNDETSARNETTTSQSKSAAAQNGNSPAQGKTGKSETSKRNKTCTTTPDASLSGVTANGSTLIATVDFSADACEDKAWKGEDVKISIKDSDNEVIASAVYDFTTKPMQFKNGETTLKLAFTTSQYWRAVSRIKTGSTSMVVQKGSTPNGKPSADVAGARGGANIADSDMERYAQLALSWQVSDDRSAISSLYDVPTTQLFSRKYGMEVDGKTQHYRDIYKQYLELHAKWPNAVLAWAADYDYYTRYGHEADYYVLLSGERFDSVSDARSWCSANAFGPNDCMAVQMD